MLGQVFPNNTSYFLITHEIVNLLLKIHLLKEKRKRVDLLSCIILDIMENLCISLERGHSGRVVTFSPSTSEIGIRFPAWPQVGNQGPYSLNLVYSKKPLKSKDFLYFLSLPLFCIH